MLISCNSEVTDESLVLKVARYWIYLESGEVIVLPDESVNSADQSDQLASGVAVLPLRVARVRSVLAGRFSVQEM